MTHSHLDRPQSESDTPLKDGPLTDGMSWAFLAYHMRLYGNDFVPPPRYRGLSLSEVEARAREEGRAEREAKVAAARLQKQLAPAQR